MTTLVALNTRDAIVMGCDSLGSVTKKLIDPLDLDEYFDPNDGFKIRLGEDGKPLLDELSKIYRKSKVVPYNHMTHVDKLFSLSPLQMGVMFAGQVSIGDRTIKNLIGEFKSTDNAFRGNPTSYTLKSVARRMLKFLWNYYEQEYPDEHLRPELELIMGGYDKRKQTPGIIRINVNENKMKDPDYDFGAYFGGQTKEIQRLVHGRDVNNTVKIIERVDELLERYRELLTEDLESRGLQVTLKNPSHFGRELSVFENWKLDGLSAHWGAFSEQNAIECVDFLVDIMVKSQQFSDEMPTVGGDVQVAVIKKDAGFSFVSKREWRHRDHSIPLEETSPRLQQPHKHTIRQNEEPKQNAEQK